MTPTQPSSLGLFWRSLVEDGRVGIFHAEPPTPDDLPGLHRFLAEHDRDNRLHLAHTPPPLDLPAAEWACILLYRACQFLVVREVEPQVVTEDLSRPCPTVLSPSVIYSADVALRHVGEVLNHASRIAADDPLTLGLQDVARRWPLSSVGVDDLGEIDIEPVLADRCLCTLYVDRIIARRDLARLDDRRVARLAAAALGAHPGLAAQISHHLSKVTAHETG